MCVSVCVSVRAPTRVHCVCVFRHVHAVYEGQKTTLGSVSFPSMWIMGVELRLSDLAASHETACS